MVYDLVHGHTPICMVDVLDMRLSEDVSVYVSTQIIPSHHRYVSYVMPYPCIL